MKKLMCFIALAMFCLHVSAALDTYVATGHASLFPATSVTNSAATTTVTGDVFDLMPYKGYATIGIFHGAELGAATNRISVVTVQQTNTVSGGWSTYRAISNATASASFTRVPFECGKGGVYLRCVYASTNANTAAAVFFNGYRDD